VNERDGSPIRSGMTGVARRIGLNMGRRLAGRHYRVMTGRTRSTHHPCMIEAHWRPHDGSVTTVTGLGGLNMPR